MYKKLSLVVIISLIVVVFTGCQFYTPSLSKLTIGTEIDNETKEVLDSADTFEKATPLLYASVFLKNAPKGTLLKASWEREGRPMTEPIELEAEGTRFTTFTLKKPLEGFRTGEYKIKVEIDKTDIVIEKSFQMQ